MKTKVGVLTYIQTINYGGILQATALQKVLTKLNYTPELIDYHAKREGYKNRPIHRKILTLGWNYVRYIFGYYKRIANTQSFLKQHNKFSQEGYNNKQKLKAKPPEYKYYIVGSDQVWNPNMIGFDSSYLLDFAPEKSVKISYAASFGVTNLTEKHKNFFKTYLPIFNAISVREKEGKTLINNILPQAEVEITLDPTLLLNKNEWTKLSSPKIEKKKYLLCYYMPGNTSVSKKIKSLSEHISQQQNLAIINIGKKFYAQANIFQDNRCLIGPSEFLTLFLNAEYIVTNSFHGVAFSVNFNKNFVAVIENSKSASSIFTSRIKPFLTKLNLDDRIVDPNSEIDISKLNNINYEPVNKIVGMEIEKSIDFLKRNLR